MFQILVAEDDKNTRRLMEAVLKGYGTKVFAVFPYRRGSETC